MDFDLDAWLASTSTRRQWMRRTLVAGGSVLGLAACGSGGGDAPTDAQAAPDNGAGSGSGTGAATGGAPAAPAGPRVFKHPGLLHTEADFTRMRAQLAAGREPWASGLRALTSSSRAQLGRDPQPVVTAIRGGDGENFRAMVEDVQRAYQLALRWKVTNDAAYAAQAVRYVNAWVSTMTTLTGNNDRVLAAGIYGYQWANAAEILRTYDGWSAADRTACQQWLLTHFYPLQSAFLKDHNGSNITNYWANWDLVTLVGMLAIGVFADRPDVYQEAIDYFNGGRGNGASRHMVYARHPGHVGQWQESGRDQGHATLSLGMAGYLCEMAWNQGDDLYGMDDNRLLAGAEYVAKSNLKDATGAFHTLPFYVYSNRQGTFTAVSDGGRPNGRPCWEVLFNHYVKRKGLAAPWVGALAAQLRPEGNTWGGDDLSFGTLTFSRDAEVSRVAPSGVQAIVRGGAAQLSWWGSAEASAHAVLRAPAGSSAFAELGRIAAGDLNTWTDSTAAQGRWQYQIRALDGAGAVLSSSATATVDLDAPLLLNLPLDDGQGTVARDVGAGKLAGALKGGASWGDGRKAGTRALALDGTSGHLELPAGVLAGVGDVTITAWVWWNGVGKGNARVFDFGSSDITYLSLLVSADATRVSVTNTSYFGEQTVSTGPLPKGRWVHLAMTLKDRTCTLFVDGATAASIATMDLAPYQLGATTQNWLGRARYGQDPYFNGRMQDLRIHGGALTPAQVQALASA
ncbi:LamG-like jellyroll fold domain-containing protein [Mitsuaria sp. GD03876]|uniref:LamG-like jellyroll fold domain-containing protein n=1 Tax=Mitsuaria sp. GD03876 TaxID=2975399 RepID=UPI0024486E13|nr:LamG-like jellyroll fold domain-containing protein [Mitsuaria sp. GD03876]MDH0865936.1 alginate lyase family protein [Mitsuaria sp. GD03876]